MKLRHESPRHCVIEDDDKDHPWVATVNTEKYPGLGEYLLKAAEKYCAASANRRHTTGEE